MDTARDDVTKDERKLSRSDASLEVALEQERALAQVIFDRADCAIIIFDAYGVIRRINKACQTITGFASEDVVGHRYMDVMVPPDLVDDALAKLSQIVNSKETLHCESPWLRKDGSRCILKGSFSAVNKHGGEIDYIIGIGVDVSAEREAQAALEWSQKRFELAVEGSQDGIWDVDVMTDERYYSQRWKEIIGYEDEELPNTLETWMDRIHPDDLDRVGLYQKGYDARPNDKHEVEFRMRHKDGSWRWILSRGKAVFNSNGRATRIAGSHKDITQTKLAQQELLESQTRLLEAQDIANLGTWELEFSTGSIWWSPQTYRIYGIDTSVPPPSMEQLMDTVHPDDKERVRLSIERTTKTGDPYRVKRRVFRPSGEMRYVVTTARIIYDSDGNRSRVVGVVQDVTEQQIAEDAILKAREQALEASRLKSEFLANMSHEIRTPMNGVIGMAEMLLDSNLDQEQQKCAYTIRTSADGLMTILNDILDFSKIEAGKLALEDSDVDILEVVEEVATIIGRSAQEKALELKIEADWGSPSFYCGDPTRIRQILTNLASNAIKFTNFGSVTLGLKTSNEGVQLWVQDTGLGIAEERHEAIFESFTQADGSTTRRYGGTGLGLAIVRQLVELMKGSVALVSEPNKGSRFDVFLPLDPTTHERGTSLFALHRIVLVSGASQTIDGLSRFFEGLGADVTAVTTSKGIDGLIQSEVAISVIVDDQSIDRSEWGMLQSASNGNNVNLILLTAKSEPPPPGFDGALTQPLTRRAVEHALLGPEGGADSESFSKTLLFSGMRVLLAEDNAVNQTVAEHQLERMGFQIDSVPNGRDAVEMAQRQRYDVILMDVQMPEMDGLTATGLVRKIQHSGKPVVILAMTAHAMQGDRERCIDAGMDDYISKPVRPQELMEKLMMWLKPESRQASKLNWDYLHEMTQNDSEFERQILTVYLNSMPPLMLQLSKAIRTQSHSAVNRLSHTLKGSSRSIGANQFADLCDEVESLSNANQPYRHVERLERQFEDLVAECERFVESGAALQRGTGQA